MEVVRGPERRPDQPWAERSEGHPGHDLYTDHAAMKPPRPDNEQRCDRKSREKRREHELSDGSLARDATPELRAYDLVSRQKDDGSRAIQLGDPFRAQLYRETAQTLVLTHSARFVVVHRHVSRTESATAVKGRVRVGAPCIILPNESHRPRRSRELSHPPPPPLAWSHLLLVLGSSAHAHRSVHSWPCGRSELHGQPEPRDRPEPGRRHGRRDTRSHRRGGRSMRVRLRLLGRSPDVSPVRWREDGGARPLPRRAPLRG